MAPLLKRPILASCFILALITDLATAQVSDEKRNESVRRRINQKHRRQQQFVPIDLSFSEDESSVNAMQSRTGNPPSDNSDVEERIIGGRSVEYGDYPFFVEWSRGCGGTLIHKDLVLSAAHCYTPGNTQMSVFVGGVRSQQARERTIAEVYVHPQYDPATESYDFVILKLDEEIRGAIQPVVLNTYPNNYREPYDGEVLTVIGYGVTDVVYQETSRTLLAADVNYIKDCYSRSSYHPGVVQDAIMFCAGVPAGNVDSCQGDSGGPILDANKRQIGIVSFGRGCGDPAFPGVYSRISAVSNWIEQMKCMSSADKPQDCVMIRIDIQYDYYPIENSWTLFDSENNAIHSVKAGEIQRSGHVPTTLVVKAGNYHLAVYDKIGDGICCLYGEGFISVYTGDSWVEESGMFGTETSVAFTVNPSQAQAARDTPYFSHLVSMRMTVNYDTFPQETSWQLVNDQTGTVVAENAPHSHFTAGLWSTDFHYLPSGNYWFSITDSADDGICCRSGVGYVKFQKIDTAGAVLSDILYIPGDFGSFHEEDFLLA